MFMQTKTKNETKVPGILTGVNGKDLILLQGFRGILRSAQKPMRKGSLQNDGIKEGGARGCRLPGRPE
jgi:hypothetical protein